MTAHLNSTLKYLSIFAKQHIKYFPVTTSPNMIYDILHIYNIYYMSPSSNAHFINI